MAETTAAQPGAQLIYKAISVLQHLATIGGQGARLTDIAAALDMNASTTHRILTALEHQRMVERAASSRNWRLGVALFALGTAAADGTGLRQVCRPSILRLASATGDSVFLLSRSGLDVVCIDRHHGSYLIESLTHNVGGAFPLAISAGGIAMLIQSPQTEIDAVLSGNADRYEGYGVSAERIRQILVETQRLGYTMTHGMTIDGVSAIALPIRSLGGEVKTSLSINMTTARLPPARVPEILALLRQEVTLIEEQLQAGAGRMN